MRVKPFPAKGTTTKPRRLFWNAAHKAVTAIQKIAGRHVTIDEFKGKGSVINVDRESTPVTCSYPNPTLHIAGTISVSVSDTRSSGIGTIECTDCNLSYSAERSGSFDFFEPCAPGGFNTDFFNGSLDPDDGSGDCAGTDGDFSGDISGTAGTFLNGGTGNEPCFNDGYVQLTAQWNGVLKIGPTPFCGDDCSTLGTSSVHTLIQQFQIPNVCNPEGTYLMDETIALSGYSAHVIMNVVINSDLVPFPTNTPSGDPPVYDNGDCP